MGLGTPNSGPEEEQTLGQIQRISKELYSLGENIHTKAAELVKKGTLKYSESEHNGRKYFKYFIPGPDASYYEVFSGEYGLSYVLIEYDEKGRSIQSRTHDEKTGKIYNRRKTEYYDNHRAKRFESYDYRSDSDDTRGTIEEMSEDGTTLSIQSFNSQGKTKNIRTITNHPDGNRTSVWAYYNEETGAPIETTTSNWTKEDRLIYQVTLNHATGETTVSADNRGKF